MTTREVLKQTGMTDEQIDALDAKVLSAFDTRITEAQQKLDAAELAQRAQEELYSNKIAPALDSWGIEKAQKDAEIAFYKTQAEGAKASGFIPKDAPGYVAAADNRAPNGQFVAGGNPVPGSPGLSEEKILEGISNSTWMIQQHMALYGQPPTEEFITVLKEATAQHLPFRDYADRKFKFSEKRNAIAEQKQKDHDQKIRDEAIKERDKHWAERSGNNPMVRTGTESQYADVSKAVAAGKRGDPLKMSAEERRAHTRQTINAELADNAARTVN